ncbi:MAG: 23S rRNA pseudouridine(1911/1915/1917) synthase RluD [Gammaproteobacteria bacterium]
MSHDDSEDHDGEPLEATVPENGAGLRLDQTLARMFPEFSRARLQSWIKAGRVSVDGELRRPRDTVYGGEAIVIDMVEENVAALAPEAMILDIVHRDDDVLVVNKPPGLVVHPGAGNPNGTLVNGLLHLDASLAALPRAGLVHRLDKDTSGVLIVARTQSAFKALTEAMARREIHREYVALCVGALSGGGTIDEPIGRHPVDRKKMAVSDRGRPARTHYRIEKRYRGYTLVAVTLETGRTHQIRVHFAHQRWPLVGDRTYGRSALPRGPSEHLHDALIGFARQALHARRLSFAHPVSGETLDVTCDMPEDFAQLLAAMDADPSQSE